jgi:hypothetical protein
MSTRLLLPLMAALLIVRLPSLVQPMGADQGLYAYVGERILHGELAYRDAWDQKPPGIHYVYAALRAISSRDVVVPAADLVAAALVAGLLWIIGSRLGGPAAGAAAAAIFLLLSDPSLARLGGARVRAQCETFIGLAVTGALALSLASRGAKGPASAREQMRAGYGEASPKPLRGEGGVKGAAVLFAAGLLIGAAFALKYNAGIYGVVLLLALVLTGGLALLDVVWIVAGASVIPLVLLAVFWRGGAVNDLYDATISYNVLYSGQTYSSAWDALTYLVRFPFERARLESLWFVGGLGGMVLLFAGFWRRAFWLPLVWVAAACVSIAINGSRSLPQYFLQAAPALALAAGLGGAFALARLPVFLRWVVVLAVAVGAWRAGADPFPKLAENVWHDAQYAFGRIDRRTHLARYGGTRDVDKYSALDNMDLGAFLAVRTRPDEYVYVFGYSPGAYVYADRRSASRFFWSRPVILDFNRERPAYGVAGLGADLQRTRPAYVILQQRDWAPDVTDSGPFFLSRPELADWLRAGYHEVPTVEGFQAWERNDR